jgi:DNA-binding helix-hairpin-helix protein with protein kinase domain
MAGPRNVVVVVPGVGLAFLPPELDQVVGVSGTLTKTIHDAFPLGHMIDTALRAHRHALSGMPGVIDVELRGLVAVAT